MPARGFARLLPLVFVACLVGLASCSDNDDSDSTAQVQTEAEAATRERNREILREHRERTNPKPTAEEREARRTAVDLYEILEDDSGGRTRTTVGSTSFCDLMSEEARARTIQYAKASSKVQQQWDCESAIELLLLRAKRQGGFERVRTARVIGVNAQGDRATATVRFGNGPAATLPLVKEGDGWKLAASSTTQEDGG